MLQGQKGHHKAVAPHVCLVEGPVVDPEAQSPVSPHLSADVCQGSVNFDPTFFSERRKQAVLPALTWALVGQPTTSSVWGGQ